MPNSRNRKRLAKERGVSVDDLGQGETNHGHRDTIGTTRKPAASPLLDTPSGLRASSVPIAGRGAKFVEAVRSRNGVMRYASKLYMGKDFEMPPGCRFDRLKAPSVPRGSTSDAFGGIIGRLIGRGNDFGFAWDERTGGSGY